MIRYLQATDDLRRYRKLYNDIYSGKCILLSDFGLSGQAYTRSGKHPPTDLKSLFEEITRWCAQTGLVNQHETEAFCKRLGPTLFDKEEISKARYSIEEYLIDKSQQQRCLSKILLCDQAEVSQLHCLIAAIPFRAYLTSNYDNFIETAYSLVWQTSLPKFYQTSVHSAIEAYQNEQPFILKLNGDIDSADSIILSNRDFKRLSASNSPDKWQKLLSGSSVLFIGFEQNIPNLESFHSLIGYPENLTYWFVLPKGQLSWSKEKHIWNKKRVSVIQYKPDAAQTELTTFLEKLIQPPTRLIAFEGEGDSIRRIVLPKNESKKSTQAIVGLENLQEPEQLKENRQILSLPEATKAIQFSPYIYKPGYELATLPQSDLTNGLTSTTNNRTAKTSPDQTHAADVATGRLEADVAENLEEVAPIVTTKSRTQAAIDIFFSYAYEDKNMQIKLLQHLQIMKFKRRIIWHDKEIGAGKERAQEIEKLLNTAHIILLLVSVDFLTSLNGSKVEMKQALKRHAEGKARVIPIILRPVYWHDAPFKKLQVLPTNAVPMTSWSNLEEAYLHVAVEIRKAIEDLIKNF